MLRLPLFITRRGFLFDSITSAAGVVEWILHHVFNGSRAINLAANHTLRLQNAGTPQTVHPFPPRLPRPCYQIMPRHRQENPYKALAAARGVSDEFCLQAKQKNSEFALQITAPRTVPEICGPTLKRPALQRGAQGRISFFWSKRRMGMPSPSTEIACPTPMVRTVGQ